MLSINFNELKSARVRHIIEQYCFKGVSKWCSVWIVNDNYVNSLTSQFPNWLRRKERSVNTFDDSHTLTRPPFVQWNTLDYITKANWELHLVIQNKVKRWFDVTFFNLNKISFLFFFFYKCYQVNLTPQYKSFTCNNIIHLKMYHIFPHQTFTFALRKY